MLGEINTNVSLTLPFLVFPSVDGTLNPDLHSCVESGQPHEQDPSFTLQYPNGTRKTQVQMGHIMLLHYL